ncbi:MAG: RidA family protein [Betaproteobacteria bacterium]|nr:RidA family protein [Betaproteobacteria bacterium]
MKLEKRVYNPKTLGEPMGPFSRAVRIGDHLYISGTSALTHQKGPLRDRPIAPDVETQTRQTLENLRSVLEDAGGTLADIYKVTVYIKRREDLDKVLKIRAEYIPPTHVSAASITELVREDMLIEIAAEAYLGR